jgi:small subunit ribosomal protein S17
MRVFKGKVISKKMEKTATVAVDRVVVHRIYGKRYKRTKKYHVHDALGSKVGDEVRFVATKPYSKLKRWKIKEVLTEKKGRLKVARKSTKGKKGDKSSDK